MNLFRGSGKILTFNRLKYARRSEAAQRAAFRNREGKRLLVAYGRFECVLGLKGAIVQQ
ncbi:hypothetical protein C8D90_101767 [Enterobacillus tribolii]|uniref:Uncharacterized protein n=1 Tax=Enterobacillus tribolii TaxID=1487935 RepID=A0A370R4F9_9GAMM|nr:hypothetical protein C8D90_101767 [Enterobacillus tribolii]